MSNKVQTETFYVLPAPHSPNSRLPIVVYRNALIQPTLDGVRAVLRSPEWVEGGHWKIAQEQVAAMPHYHSNAHECYGVIHGSGHYLLGKSPLDPEVDTSGRPIGARFVANAGDVFVFPVYSSLVPYLLSLVTYVDLRPE